MPVASRKLPFKSAPSVLSPFGLSQVQVLSCNSSYTLPRLESSQSLLFYMPVIVMRGPSQNAKCALLLLQFIFELNLSLWPNLIERFKEEEEKGKKPSHAHRRVVSYWR